MSNSAFAWEWLFLLCSRAEPEASHLYRRGAAPHSHRVEDTVWMSRSQIPYHTNTADYFTAVLFCCSFNGSRAQKSGCRWRPLCSNPDGSASLHCLWGISTFASVCLHKVSIYLFLHKSRFKYDRGERRGVSVLSCAAVSTVCGFVPKLRTGLPLNAIRLQLWLFALFNYSRNAFWSVW